MSAVPQPSRLTLTTWESLIALARRLGLGTRGARFDCPLRCRNDVTNFAKVYVKLGAVSWVCDTCEGGGDERELIKAVRGDADADELLAQFVEDGLFVGLEAARAAAQVCVCVGFDDFAALEGATLRTPSVAVLAATELRMLNAIPRALPPRGIGFCFFATQEQRFSMEGLARKLSAAGASAVKVVPIPSGRSLEEWLRKNPKKLQEALAGLSSPSGTDEEWPEPVDVGTDSWPLPEFDPRLIPGGLRDWLVDRADAMQMPIEFFAVTAISMAGALIGRQCGVRPKQHDPWFVIPNLWGAIVGFPGDGKTPATATVLKPLERIVSDHFDKFADEQRKYSFDKKVAEARKDALEEKLREAIKKGEDVAQYASEEPGVPAQPSPRRFLINDATVEKIGELLGQNPNGLLQFRDELMGFLASLEKPDRKSDRSFYLEAWNGTREFVYDRIGRGTIRIPAATLTVVGGIQPDRLRDYVLAVVNGTADNDGLMQRFQVMVFPRRMRSFQYVDRPPDARAQESAFELIRELTQLSSRLPPVGPGEIPTIGFDSAAQERFIDWYTDNQRRVRSLEEHPAFTAHLTKYSKLVAGIALIFQVVESVASNADITSIGAEAIERAIEWATFLEAHARKVYAYATVGGPREAELLAIWIEKGKLSSPFTIHNVTQKHWSGLDDPDRVGAALAHLEKCGWVRAEAKPSGPSGGRPTTRYFINPRVLDRAHEP